MSLAALLLSKKSKTEPVSFSGLVAGLAPSEKLPKLVIIFERA
jgi:hypothetical protein